MKIFQDNSARLTDWKEAEVISWLQCIFAGFLGKGLRFHRKHDDRENWWRTMYLPQTPETLCLLFGKIFIIKSCSCDSDTRLRFTKTKFAFPFNSWFKLTWESTFCKYFSFFLIVCRVLNLCLQKCELCLSLLCSQIEILHQNIFFIFHFLLNMFIFMKGS